MHATGAEPASARRRRILLIANRTCPCPALQREIRKRAEQADSEVLIVAPALNTRVKHWMSDVDEARTQAEARLASAVEGLHQSGVPAEGQVGDSRPMQAIEDALRTFSADEIVISTHPSGRSHWLERGLIEQAMASFDVPVTHVVSHYGLGEEEPAVTA